jgi:hypothetical protein
MFKVKLYCKIRTLFQGLYGSIEVVPRGHALRRPPFSNPSTSHLQQWGHPEAYIVFRKHERLRQGNGPAAIKKMRNSGPTLTTGLSHSSTPIVSNPCFANSRVKLTCLTTV